MLLLTFILAITLFPRHDNHDMGKRNKRRRRRRSRWQVKDCNESSDAIVPSSYTEYEVDTPETTEIVKDTVEPADIPETPEPVDTPDTPEPVENKPIAPTGGEFTCSGTAVTEASFYDVMNASENDGYTGQVACGSDIPEDGLYAAVHCFSEIKCGDKVVVTYGDKQVVVPVIDHCASGACRDSLIDLSIGAWTSLESDTNIGVLEVSVSRE